MVNQTALVEMKIVQHFIRDRPICGMIARAQSQFVQFVNMIFKLLYSVILQISYYDDRHLKSIFTLGLSLRILSYVRTPRQKLYFIYPHTTVRPNPLIQIVMISNQQRPVVGIQTHTERHLININHSTLLLSQFVKVIGLNTF